MRLLNTVRVLADLGDKSAYRGWLYGVCLGNRLHSYVWTKEENHFGALSHTSNAALKRAT